MAETANPTTEQVLDALPLVDSRISAAQAEIVRRLRLNLPGAIDAVNARCSLTGANAIPKPKTYDIAPFEASDHYVNQILVSVAVEKQSHSPGVFRTEAQAVVFCLDARIQGDVQVARGFDRAGVVQAVLYHFLTGCEDAAGRKCWRLLEPQSVTMIPSDMFEDLSGLMISYRLVMDPTQDNWR